MAETKDYTQQVWAGDERTVAEACKRYEANPNDGLIAYAVALYSLRNKKQYASELISLLHKLIELANREIAVSSPEDPALYSKIAERADTLSTHLEWISRQPGLREDARNIARMTASMLCNHGLYFAAVGNDPKKDHTVPLLHLTLARLWLKKNDAWSALNHLQGAVEVSADIPDVNQRARVYRKIGMLYRKCWRPVRGIVWGLRAVFVGGTTVAVRAKSVAALLGIGD